MKSKRLISPVIAFAMIMLSVFAFTACSGKSEPVKVTVLDCGKSYSADGTDDMTVGQLLEKAETPEEKMTYLNQYLEDFKSTVFRQTMFAEFEKISHEARENGEVLTHEFLEKIYNYLKNFHEFLF